MKVMSFHDALAKTLVGDSTRPIRLILALVEWCFVSYLLAQHGTEQFDKMLEFGSVWQWSMAYLAHSAFLIYGLRGYYNQWTLWGEGLFGMSMWFVAAVTNWYSQGAPGPTLACFLAMTVIVARYPTHNKFAQGTDR